jgi:hypothetical protein
MIMNAITAALAPLWETPLALADVLGVAHAGTTLFTFIVFLAALEFLRRTAGVLAYVARIGAVISFGFMGASLQYGDFLAPPVHSVLMLMSERMPESKSDTALLATLGVATLGVAYRAGKSNGLNATSAPPRRSRTAYASSKSGLMQSSRERVVTLGITERLHLRQLAGQPKKPANRYPKTMRTPGPARTWG